jgi:beta-carotene 3-hydroxylase
MEMYARWAHKALWHDFQPGWAIHESHHQPRIGPFEANDIFAVMNAVPAIALTAYGFFSSSDWGGICFGLGMGITVFGIAYMFVHDGLVHKRFPVGPVAHVPQLRRIAIAHRIHHTEKYGGLPYGMFLGPQELEAVGAGPELDRMVEEAIAREKSEEQVVSDSYTAGSPRK